MENVMKFVNVDILIRVCLWGMFVAGLAFLVLGGITSIGVLSTIGILLLAIDYPKKEKRDKK